MGFRFVSKVNKNKAKQATRVTRSLSKILVEQNKQRFCSAADRIFSNVSIRKHSRKHAP